MGFGLVLASASAAELQSETVRAWEDYVRSATASTQQRVASSATFIWIDEFPDRAQRVREGEILVAPVAWRKVPSGLIHHWIGAVFIPNARLEDLIGVLRNYEAYRDYYPPSVLEARSVSQSRFDDRFCVLLMNKALVRTLALEGEYESTYVPLDDHRWYSISRSARLQEIENYGRPDERRLAPGEGSGYIWRLFTISRFQERGAGVVAEIEVIALSRPVQAAVRWFVDPIIQQVAKSSLTKSLRQMRAATSRVVSSRRRGAPVPPTD